MDAKRAVGALSPSDQELFALIYDQQLSQDELCERLGISAQTYQQRKSRLLRRLAQFLRPQGGTA
nr:sigma factor-like helix-turn-helix DNA-binding protein [Nannocystis pusilla]